MINRLQRLQKIYDLLKKVGIQAGEYMGKGTNVKKLFSGDQISALKNFMLDALQRKGKTFNDAKDVLREDAKFLNNANPQELVNYHNNLLDYVKYGGKTVPSETSNVVSTKGAPIVGKQFENLASRKGAKGPADETSMEGSVEGLMTLVDEVKGISPKMRNQMNRDELAEFIQNMRGKKFTNDEVKWVKNYMDEWGIGMAKSKAAPSVSYAKKLGAKDSDEIKFVEEYLENIKTTSPEKFKESHDVKKVNMDINSAIESKLEKHFKKKYNWDKSKGIDGGLDDVTFEKYDDELYQAQAQFGKLSRRKTGRGMFDEESWGNHPNNYLEEAGNRFESITGEKLNVDFYKNYTDDVLNKYKVEKFNQGGRVLAASGGLIDVLKL